MNKIEPERKKERVRAGERKSARGVAFYALYMIGNITKHIKLMGQILLCMGASAIARTQTLLLG